MNFPSKILSSLREWLSVQGDFEDRDPSSLSRFLCEVDPQHFSNLSISKDGSKTVLYENMLNRILRFYKEKLNLSLVNFPLPSPDRVVDGVDEDNARLLQLILGCAVHCDRKRGYISVIMSMEESVQRIIMTLIQELMDLPPFSSSSSSSLQGSLEPLRKLEAQLSEAHCDRESLLQRVHDLENSVVLLLNEKSNLKVEVELLRQQSGTSGPSTLEESGLRFKELQKQVESLQEELVSLENAKYEYQIKADILEKRLEETLFKESELQKLAEESRKWKDEVDVLRESAEKVLKCEAAVESYKKKMDELSDVKRQVKMLEEKNNGYMRRNLDLENDMKKNGIWKPQIELYKKEISELRSKLDIETGKSDKLDFEMKKLIERLEALSLERDRIASERDELKESNNDLSDEIKMTLRRGNKNQVFEDPDSALLENIPSNVKELIYKLQRENKMLKKNECSSSSPILATMVEDLKERERDLQGIIRKSNQRILELESQLEEMPQRVICIPGSREELELKYKELSKKNSQLTSVLHKKELEMQGMEERYKKYIEKAKTVINTLDPKQHVPTTTTENSSIRNDKNISLCQETEHELMASVFYNFSAHMQRNKTEKRLSNLSQQSFLTKQRQVCSNAKGIVDSPDY